MSSIKVLKYATPFLPTVTHSVHNNRYLSTNMNYKIRAAGKEDCKDIARLILDLAVFVKMPDRVKISHEELERDGFCQRPFFECVVAEVPEDLRSKDGYTVVGYGIYFYTYSPWKGRSVYLEDLYVMPEFRGNGIGTSLLCQVAKVAVEKQCVHLDLVAFDWNSAARGFYAAKGAQDLTESEGRHVIRFNGLSLDNLVKEARKD